MVVSDERYYVCLIRYESSIGIVLLQYVCIVCILYFVSVSTDIAESMCSLSFFVPFEIWFSGGCTSSYFTFFD